MFHPPAMLGRALLVSILLHAFMIEVVMRLVPGMLRAPEPPLHAIDVRLRAAPPPAPIERPSAPAAAPQPRLLLPRSSQANASAPPPALAAPRQSPSPEADRSPRVLAGEAARSAHSQVARALLYPREAIEQGLEGQATVLLFLDEAGNVTAARLERSSGHALLDDAALAAARTVKALPEGAPREALLPVRFRLR